MQALVALHGLWILALAPFAAWAVRKRPPRRLALVGYTLTAAGLLALAVLIGRELWTWYPAAPPDLRKYVGQRLLYVLGTNTDLPVVQVILTGIALWTAARRRKHGPMSDGPPVPGDAAPPTPAD